MANTAGDVRAGGAWYELWGKDKLTPVLEAVKKNAESLGGALKSAGKKTGAGLDTILGNFKGKAVEFGTKLVADTLVGVADLVLNVEALRKEYEKTARAIAAVDQASDRNSARRAAVLESEIETGRKRIAIEAEMKRIEAERLQITSGKESLQDRKDRLGAFGQKGTAVERAQGYVRNMAGMFGITGGVDEARADVQALIDAQNTALDKTFARLQELNTQLGDLKNPDRDPEKIKAVAELTRELKKQADTFGQTAEQVKLAEMALDNFSKTQIAAVAAAQQQLKLSQTLGGAAAELATSVGGTAKDLADEVRETTKALKEQAETFGLSAERATLLRLKLKGLTDAALAPARAKVEQIEFLNKLAGAADAIANGVASAERLTLASPGTFSGANAAQRFGPDALELKALKAAEQTAKNTDAMVKGFTELAKGLRFK